MIADMDSLRERTTIESQAPSGLWTPITYNGPYYTESTYPLGDNVGHLWYADAQFSPDDWHRLPGTWGKSLRMRLKLDDSVIPGITVNLGACLDMINVENRDYCPWTEVVHVRQPDYVPDITQGLQTCSNTYPDCAPCVRNLIGQVTGSESLKIWSADARIRLRIDPGYDLDEHNQGIAHLRDMMEGAPSYAELGLRRAVLTENAHEGEDAGKGFHVLHQEIVDSSEGLYSTTNSFTGVTSLDIMNEEEFGGHAHPGGIQAAGDIVAVAMTSKTGTAPTGAVYIIRVSGTDPEYVQTVWLNGSRGEPYQDGDTKASTVGITKLLNGYYLMAVSGPEHGRDGIWFYESADTELNWRTKWYYVGYYSPECVGYGSITDDCYVGSGGGLSLHTDCSGQVYLLAMHGTDGRQRQEYDDVGVRDYEYLQIFAVAQGGSDGRKVLLRKAAQQYDNLHGSAWNDESFRWAGGSYVSNDGRLAIFNLERRRNVEDNPYVDGHIYLGKPF